MADTSLKDLLIEKGMPELEISKFTSYVAGAKAAEANKEKKPVTNNTTEQLAGLALKYFRLGAPIDGTNTIISGRNMAMVTYHGYKNKVLSVYPETEFDVQLVREGDTFSFSKESGAVIYTHNIADPFGASESQIIGAYVVFKNKRGEFLETLNKADFDKMKAASKQPKLWGEWESEFWLKSVIKRACKRHFNDVIAEIDKNDNEDYGMVMDGEKPVPTGISEDRLEAAIKSLATAKSVDDLKAIFLGLGTLMSYQKVVDAMNAKKEELMATQPTKPTPGIDRAGEPAETEASDENN